MVWSKPLGTEVTVHALKEQDYDEWIQLVSGSPDGNVFSLPGYLDALCSAAGGHFSILGVRYGGELSGGIALYERDSRFGTLCISSPSSLLQRTCAATVYNEVPFPTDFSTLQDHVEFGEYTGTAGLFQGYAQLLEFDHRSAPVSGDRMVCVSSLYLCRSDRPSRPPLGTDGTESASTHQAMRERWNDGS